MERIEFRAMGSTMLAILERPEPTAGDPLQEVPRWFATWEEHLSRFRDDSELSRLNQRQGEWMDVSPVMWQVVGAACRAAAETDGLVSPALLDAMEASGYDRSFDLLSTGARGNRDDKRPAQAQLAAPCALSWWTIGRDGSTQAVRLPPGMRLDLGGIAKGWAADRAAEQLATYGAGLVDAGGDIAVSGPLADGAPWPIGVADPNAPETDIEMLFIHRGGVATSGRDYRRWQHGGAWQHHILDPRTGRAARTDVMSATVVAPTACEAEAAAKVALILGSRDGLAWLDARPALAGLMVLEDGQVVRSGHLDNYLHA